MATIYVDGIGTAKAQLIDQALAPYNATYQGTTGERKAWTIAHIADILPILQRLTADYGIDFLI